MWLVVTPGNFLSWRLTGLLYKKNSVQPIITRVRGYLLKLLGMCFWIWTFAGHIMRISLNTWYKRLIQVVKILEIELCEIAKMSARWLCNSPSLSLIRTIKNSANNGICLFGPGLFTCSSSCKVQMCRLVDEAKCLGNCHIVGNHIILLFAIYKNMCVLIGW